MKKSLIVGQFELTWLNGGSFALDGGAMFGVVPKILWSKKYPADEENFVPLVIKPILVKTPDALIVIETGIGNKLTEKQKKIYRLKGEWNILSDLKGLGIKREDIDFVILTHYDFDHAGGVVMQDSSGQPELTFPEARHIIQRSEWEDVVNPNKRSVNTYWPVNNELLRKSIKLELVDGKAKIIKGLSVMLTGGHSRGHQSVVMESDGQSAIHLGDLLPTHANFNPLWVTAYDNFPLASISQKEELEEKYIGKNAWFTFYHDPFMSACRFDRDGNILEKFYDHTEEP